MKYTQAPIEKILTEGSQAGRFSFSFEPNVAELARSIKTVGVIHPPILRMSRSGFDVVCGFKRVLACKHNGIGEIAALIYDADELSDEKCLWLSLIDNEWSTRKSPVEQAIVLKKFSEQGYDTDRLAKEIAPRLGLPTSKRYVENCLRLLSLDGEILRAVHDGPFGAEQAFCLYNLEPDSRLAVFHILRACKTNLNETRELISLIPDVAAMKDIPVREFVESEIGPIVGDDSLPPRAKLERLRKHLISLRYRRLSEAESKFAAIVSEIGLAKSCHISPPRYFEGNDISIAIKAGSAEELARILQKLLSSGMEEKFGQLFSIIRGRGTS